MNKKHGAEGIVGIVLAALIALSVIASSASTTPAASTGFNLKAVFSEMYGGKISKIIGGPYTGKSTGGILQIGRKHGTLDLRFSPGSSPLLMGLDQMITQGNCAGIVALPASPFNISSFSAFTYKEAYLEGLCSDEMPISGYGTSEDDLNLLGMVAGETRYIQIHIRFEVAGFPDYFVMRPNKTDAIESQFVGIVAVTGSDLSAGFPGVDHWEFRPLACPIDPVQLADEANINQTYPVGRRVSGSCSHGNFVVPFLLVLDRIS